MMKVPLILVASLASLLALPPDAWPQDQDADVPPIPSLAEAYKAFFPIGAAVEPRCLSSRKDLLASQVNSLVAENAMKWENIHPRAGDDAGSYNFIGADRIASFAGKHDMKLRGHTLVWHQMTPAWVFEGADGRPAARGEVIARMKRHIETLLARYKGRVYCWDVVNEAISDFGGWRTDSPWYKAAGSDDDRDGIPDYIAEAFACARAADPAARLFYNDYNLEPGLKLDRACALVKALKARGLIDGVGIQGHWSLYDPDWEKVRGEIERLAALGVEVQITELDLSVYRWNDRSSLAALPESLERLQGERCAGLFRMLRGQASAGRLTGVTFWGIADDHTWLRFFPVQGRADWPLPFDAKHRPKSAFRAIVKW